MILPGMIMMKESLQRGTASLGLERGKVDLQARSTADAIETGAAYAQRGAIELARRDFEPGAALLISGGAGGTLAALLSSPFEVVPLLTLEGLFILARAHGRQA
jgi:type III pantothenate kinase